MRRGGQDFYALLGAGRRGHVDGSVDAGEIRDRTISQQGQQAASCPFEDQQAPPVRGGVIGHGGLQLQGLGRIGVPVTVQRDVQAPAGVGRVGGPGGAGQLAGAGTA